MRELLLVRFGEVHLKGQNRPYFLRVLVENLRRATAPVGGRVFLADSRIYVTDASDMEELILRATRVFGVHSVSPAIEMDKSDFDKVALQAAEMMRGMSGTFKVLARRSDKRYPLDSMQIAREAGGVILRENPQLSVDVHKPQHEMQIEIRDHAYLCVRVVPGAGGMPIGTGGKAALLLSGGIDSPVAGYMIAKRGVSLCAVHFYSFPYTSERAKQKVIDLAQILTAYTGKMTVYVAPFTNAQMQIHQKCPEGLGTVIMRRMMMRIAQQIAMKHGAQALITGESIAQVASQTMEALGCTDAVADIPVFRPVIGMDKLEITAIAQRIGTYDVSIQPFEDCCTVFTPRHPTIRPKLAEVEKAEERLDVQALVDEVLLGVEAVELQPR